MITINGKFNLDNLRLIWQTHTPIKLATQCNNKINASVNTIKKILAEDKIVYGINTGFGKLAQTKIADNDLAELQHRLLLSHATGVGALLDDAIVRLIMVIKINSLAQGFSGIRLEVINALITLYNHAIYPCVPTQGSVGASGDLAPLAHLSCVLLGVGEVRY